MRSKYDNEAIAARLAGKALPLRSDWDIAPLLQRIGDARIVMLGEASHGTQEFYDWRRRISQRLIREKGFNFIAVEGDWPDAVSLDRYLKQGEGDNAYDVLSQYCRWPTWMWANTAVVELAEWLRAFNLSARPGNPCSFYGLDIYSLFESIDAILQHVREIDPFLEKRVSDYYSCFEPYNRNEIAYARSTLIYPEGCVDEVVQALQEVMEARVSFETEQNARVIRNAERYYRAMMRADVNSWNIRDTHMMDTLDQLLEQHGPNSKAIVWAHNTHIGDYRFTDMVEDGSVNIGGLARERYGAEQVVLVGFGTHRGTVTASHAWDGPTQTLRVPPGRPGSYEDLFEQACARRALPQCLVLFDESDRRGELAEVRGHRAIGVVYDPDHERWGNYVPTSLSRRYDAFCFMRETGALTALPTRIDRTEIPETWPSAQ